MKIKVYWLIPFIAVIVILSISNSSNRDLLHKYENKEKVLKNALKTLKNDRLQDSLDYVKEITKLKDQYKKDSLEADNKIKSLQTKKVKYEKDIIEYLDSDFDDKYEFFANLIGKDSI